MRVGRKADLVHLKYVLVRADYVLIIKLLRAEKDLKFPTSVWVFTHMCIEKNISHWYTYKKLMPLKS